MLQLTGYGGVGQIGGNQFLLEDGERRLLLDFGQPFGLRGQFYEEFLKPRSAFGLLDPLIMGLLPPLRGLYRADLGPPAEDLWEELQGAAGYRDLRDAEIGGVLLTHAHLDHSGYLSFVRWDVPVLATPLTAFIAKSVQDSGRTEFESETVYAVPRVPAPSGLLQSSDYHRVPAQQRPYQAFGCENLGEEARAFWQDTPGSRSLSCVPLGAAQDVCGLEVRSYAVDHSIPGACAYAIKSSAGWVAYTGDLRLHGHGGLLTRKCARELKALRPVVLLCEGTRADLEREGRPNHTEQEVRERAYHEVRQARGLVIADFGPRNVERLLIFAAIARETSRALVVMPKDAYLLKAAHLADPGLPSVMGIANALVYDEPRLKRDRWEQDVMAECLGRLVRPEQVRRSQGEYILCFSFFDLDQLPTIRPLPGSLYLYSSCEAFNEDIQCDFRRLRAWVERFRMRGVGLPLEELGWGYVEGEEGLHASGHADPTSLLELVQEVSPATLIPIHTTEKGVRFFQERLRGTGIRVEEARYGCPIVLG